MENTTKLNMNCKNCNLSLDTSLSGFIICKNCGHVNIADNQEKHNIPLQVRAPSIYSKRNFDLPAGAMKKPKRFNKRVTLLASACFGVFLILTSLVLGVSNYQAENYFAKAKTETASLDFEKADEYLNKTNKLFAFPGTKKGIKDLKEQNTVWLKDSDILNEVEGLIEEKDYAKALELLKQVSKSYPDKDKISTLYLQVQTVLDSHAINPENIKDNKKIAESQPTKPKNQAETTTPVTPTTAPCPTYSTIPTRSTTDRPDDSSDFQVHFIYLLPKDMPDRSMDTSSAITNSVSSFQTWLCGQSGGKYVKVDTAGGALDVSFVRLNSTDNVLKTGAELPWATNPSTNPYLLNDIDFKIKALGFNNPNKIYAVYYDGNSNYSCGAGSWPPVVPGKIGGIFMYGRNQAWPADINCQTNQVGVSATSPQYFDYAMLHEIFHTLGFVANCAPHANNSHTTDNNNDLMYTGSLPWYPSLLDPGNDDYYGTKRTDCIDLSNSAFLVGGGNVLPSGW